MKNKLGKCRQCGADLSLESPSSHNGKPYAAVVRCSSCRLPVLDHAMTVSKVAAERAIERAKHAPAAQPVSAAVPPPAAQPVSAAVPPPAAATQPAKSKRG